MKDTDFLRALETALEIDAHSIAGDEPLDGVGWWDSMAALVFMSLADQELHVTVSGTQLQQCKTVPDLLQLLGDKLTR